MSFHKSHFIFAVGGGLLMAIFSVSMSWRWGSVNAPYLTSLFPLSDFYGVSVSLDYIGVSFLTMLFVVCAAVSMYSAVYFEHYNNTKMFTLFLSFFLAMTILSLSNSFLSFLLGWESLGLSSICLIMFYPNKNTSFNSILTMAFNRLGDVVIFLIMCTLLIQLPSILSNVEVSPLFVLLVLICASTKSAQIPFNSWLPAAMSAPTPISAMVHSSTLVTAGIFLILKFSSFHFYSGVSNLISLLFISTFFVGGLLANLDMDLKKVVAFSTMSQISMILLFASAENFMSLAILHMVFHAMFKTLLFLACGVLFMFSFSDQFKSSCQSVSVFLSFLFFLSLYSMSGLVFSSSFFSKDYLLESLNSESLAVFALVMILGSILTLGYCSYLGETFINSSNMSSSFYQKKLDFNFLTFFAFTNMFLGMFLSTYVNVDCFSLLNSAELIFIPLIFLSALIYLKLWHQPILDIGVSLLNLKFFTYSWYGGFFKSSKLSSLLFSDFFFFKYKNFGTLTVPTPRMWGGFLAVLVMFLTLSFYPFSSQWMWLWSS